MRSERERATRPVPAGAAQPGGPPRRRLGRGLRRDNAPERRPRAGEGPDRARDRARPIERARLHQVQGGALNAAKTAAKREASSFAKETVTALQ